MVPQENKRDLDGSFATGLARLLGALDMRQVEFAQKLGVSENTVTNWKNGAYAPKSSRLPEIASVLGVTLDELLTAGSPGGQEPRGLTSPGAHRRSETETLIVRLAEAAPNLMEVLSQAQEAAKRLPE